AARTRPRTRSAPRPRPPRPRRAAGRACSSCSTRFRPTRQGGRAGRRTTSAFLAPPPHELVGQAAAHQLVERAGGELFLEIDRAIPRELVHETGEFGGHEDAEVLVLGLRGHFARGHNAHYVLPFTD